MAKNDETSDEFGTEPEITCQHCGAATVFARTGGIDGYEVTFWQCAAGGYGHLTRTYSDGTLVDGVAVRYPSMGIMLDGTITVSVFGPTVRIQVPGPWAEMLPADATKLTEALAMLGVPAIESVVADL